MKQLFFRFLKDQRGATAIEYGLIAAGISLVIAAIVFAFGEQIGALFQSFIDALEGAQAG